MQTRLLARLRVVVAAAVFATSALTAPAVLAAEAPLALATIVPVHSLVEGVMEGVAEPELLVPPGIDPAQYSPTQQDQNLIRRADVFFLVGNELSVNFGAPTGTAANAPTVVTLGDAPGVTPALGDAPPVERGGPAMWLDPAVAKTWVRMIAETLAEIDQSNAYAYSANAEGMLARLDALQTEIKRLVETGPQGVVRIVFDDTFMPFDRAFQLGMQSGYDITGWPGEATINPPGRAGTQLMAGIRGQAADAGPLCVVSRAGVSGEPARQQAAQAGAEVASIDIMGGEPGRIPNDGALEGPGSDYLDMVRQAAEDIIRCGG